MKTSIKNSKGGQKCETILVTNGGAGDKRPRGTKGPDADKKPRKRPSRPPPKKRQKTEIEKEEVNHDLINQSHKLRFPKISGTNRTRLARTRTANPNRMPPKKKKVLLRYELN